MGTTGSGWKFWAFNTYEELTYLRPFYIDITTTSSEPNGVSTEFDINVDLLTELPVTRRIQASLAT